MRVTLEHEPEEHAYMWKQRDYVPSGLSVWRPVSEAEIKDLPNAIVTYGEGPFKPDQIMQPGMKGIPTDTPPVERIPHARIPVYVNPDIAPHLEPMLETTRSKNALIRAFLAVSKETKSDLLALSPFHWATILNRTLESGMNPFGGGNRKFIFMPKDIDYYNLNDAQSASHPFRRDSFLDAARIQRLSRRRVWALKATRSLTKFRSSETSTARSRGACSDLMAGLARSSLTCSINSRANCGNLGPNCHRNRPIGSPRHR